MSSNNASRKVVSVDEQAFEQVDNETSTEPLQATVKQETQAKVDANHPDEIADMNEDRIHGVTLDVDDAQASEEFQEWLDVQSRFHDYSHRNTLLITL